MAKRMLADVLWEAANEHLRSSIEDFGRSNYTCDTIFAASGRSDKTFRRVITFLGKLGLPSDSLDRYDLFDAFEHGEQRQGVRYMWLLLAAKVAEDEGIEV